MKRNNRLREISIKKTGIFLIETPIFRLNTAKTRLLESYNQKICGFIDRNPGREQFQDTALCLDTARPKNHVKRITGTPVSTLRPNKKGSLMMRKPLFAYLELITLPSWRQPS